MRSLTKNICLIAGWFLMPLFLMGQPVSVTDGLPGVFVLGEHEKEYDALIPHYDQLLAACDNDMKTAFEKWLSMTLEMEAYARQTNFDLSGIKMWVHVFWNADGRIDHIGYHLKPNSRFVPNEEMTAFWEGFKSYYHFPLIANAPYAHYTVISFPVFFKKMDKRAAQNE